MYDYRPLEDFSFDLHCEDEDVQQILEREISRTCDYIEENSSDGIAYFAFAKIEEEVYLTIQMFYGKACFGIFYASVPRLEHESDGENLALPVFAHSMRELRDRSMDYDKRLRRGESIPRLEGLPEAWAEYDLRTFGPGYPKREALQKIYTFLQEEKLNRGIISSCPLALPAEQLFGSREGPSDAQKEYEKLLFKQKHNAL